MKHVNVKAAILVGIMLSPLATMAAAEDDEQASAVDDSASNASDSDKGAIGDNKELSLAKPNDMASKDASPATAAPSSATTGEDLKPKSRATRWGNGERIDIQGKGFSIVPPQGWEIYNDIPGSSLVFQVPMKEGLKYQATIQVGVYEGPKYIDKLTAMQFRDEIVKRYSNMPSVQQYEIRDEASLTFDDGTPGILYYTDFLLGDAHMMQMHVLTSSNDHHFLMTYTDLAEAFSNRDDASHLNLAYASTISARTETHPTSRVDIATMLGIGIGFLVVAGFLYRIWSIRRLRRFADEENAAVGSETIPHGGDGSTSAISQLNAKLVFSKDPAPVRSKPTAPDEGETWELKNHHSRGEQPLSAMGDENEGKWSNLNKSSTPQPIDEEKERWQNLSRKEAKLGLDDEDLDEGPTSKVG